VDFVFDRYTPLPADAQIQEQIKVALLLGILRPGDTLPSIRDVENDVGISRNLVRKAYVELQRWGILSLQHGKRVIVDPNLKYGEKSDVSDQCDVVSHQLIGRLFRMGVSPSAFARYLYRRAREEESKRPLVIYVDASRTQAEERAATISAAWGLPVPGITIDELKAMQPAERGKIRKILISYLRYDQILRIVRGKASDVIPVGLTIEGATAREFASLHSGASVVYVLHDQDYPSLSLFVEPFRKLLRDQSIKIECIPLGKIPKLTRLVQSKEHSLILFSNRLWDELPDSIKNHPKVARPKFTVDLGSLESVRIRAGVVV
jgi:DNA-binding transcriptional regulator YhcF (GntR family)